MKTKMILLIVVSAIITLSFTFAATRSSESKKVTTEAKAEKAPIGGFVSEERN